jgi:hypothetical protein
MAIGGNQGFVTVATRNNNTAAGSDHPGWLSFRVFPNFDHNHAGRNPLEHFLWRQLLRLRFRGQGQRRGQQRYSDAGSDRNGTVPCHESTPRVDNPSRTILGIS